MSTFLGKIEHFPAVSIDRFDGENEKSEVFFLSHCHSDHMRGLYACQGPLYLSPISAVFVRKLYPLIKNLVELELGQPHQINTSDGAIVVTTFPAYHCPGSVMFLFQNQDVTVLYTGDIRLNGEDLGKISALKVYENKIDEMHLDSTFLNDNYLHFPSQEKSAKMIAELISEWIDVGDEKRKVRLKISAKYGYEWLFIQINKILKKKIYVDMSVYDAYCYFPDMDRVYTFNKTGAQIYASNNYSCGPFSPEDDVREIRISALYWKDWHPTKPCVEKVKNQVYRVCYSNHSSLTELKELICFFKPKQIFLNVLSEKDKERREMTDLRDNIMKEYQPVLEEPKLIADTKEPQLNISFSNIAKSGKRKSEIDLGNVRQLQLPVRNSSKRLIKDSQTSL